VITDWSREERLLAEASGSSGVLRTGRPKPNGANGEREAKLAGRNQTEQTVTVEPNRPKPNRANRGREAKLTGRNQTEQTVAGKPNRPKPNE